MILVASLDPTDAGHSQDGGQFRRECPQAVPMRVGSLCGEGEGRMEVGGRGLGHVNLRREGRQQGGWFHWGHL